MKQGPAARFTGQDECWRVVWRRPPAQARLEVRAHEKQAPSLFRRRWPRACPTNQVRAPASGFVLELADDGPDQLDPFIDGVACMRDAVLLGKIERLEREGASREIRVATTVRVGLDGHHLNESCSWKAGLQ